MDTFEVTNSPTLANDLPLVSNPYGPCDHISCRHISLPPEKNTIFLEENTSARETYSGFAENSSFPDLSASLGHPSDVNELHELIDMSLPPVENASSDFPADRTPALHFEFEDNKETERLLATFTDYNIDHVDGRLVDAATNTFSADGQPLEMVSGSTTPRSQAVECKMDFEFQNERRRKNNKASRRSRAKRKDKFKALEKDVSRLEISNLQLKLYLEYLDGAIQEAKGILLLRP